MSSSNLIKSTIKETLSYLNDKINDKANDSSVVKLSGDQFIDGDKTFNGSLFATTPNDSENSERVATTEFVKNLLQNASTRNIGEIVYSTIPLTDAGLHLLDGSVISGNGIYSEFVSYIAELDQTANYFCTEEEWQTSVSSYGVCGKFVYDSENNTVRLPKITGFIEGTVDLSALGSLVEAGLPNITGAIQEQEPTSGSYDANLTDADTFSTTGALGVEHEQRNFYNGTLTDHGEQTVLSAITFDASKSNNIYSRSNTVQPQSTKSFVYIVISTAQKLDINVDINEIATDLNSKVDKSDLQEVQCVVETYSNTNSWYRLYSDGWCEQGGSTSSGAWTQVYLLKPYKDSNYTITTGTIDNDTNYAINLVAVNSKTSSSFWISNSYNGSATECPSLWHTCGYIDI